MTEQQQGPTLGVRFREVSAVKRVKENDCGRTTGTNSSCSVQRSVRLIES